MPDTKKLMDDFDPAKLDCWATVIPAASGKHEITAHYTRAAALNRIGRHNYILLYRLENGQWKEVVRKCREDHQGRCSHCGASTVTTDNNIPWSRNRWFVGSVNGVDHYDTGNFCLRRVRNRVTDPIECMFLCEACIAAGVANV